MRYVFALLILCLSNVFIPNKGIGEVLSNGLYSHAVFEDFPENPSDIFNKAFGQAKTFRFDGGKSVQAIRYAFTNDFRTDESFILQHNPLIDDLRVYLRHANGEVTSFRSGMAVPVSQRNFRGTDYLFNLKLEPGETVEIVSAARGVAPFNLSPAIYQNSDFLEHEANVNLLFGIYLGIVSIIGLMSALLLFLTKERMFVFHLMEIVFTHILGTMTPYGLTNLYVFSESPLVAAGCVITIQCLMIISTLGFCQAFLLTKKDNPILSALAKSIYFFCAVVIILSILFSGSPLIPPAADLLTGLAMMLVFAIGIVSIRNKKTGALIYLVGWVTFIIGAIFFILQDQGIIEASDFARYALIIGSFFECILFVFAIAFAYLRIIKELNRHKGQLSTVLEQEPKSAVLTATRLLPTTAQEMKLAILFIDTVEFSTTMEMFSINREKVVNELTENLKRLRSFIRKHSGTVVNTEGDSVFAVFGIAHKGRENDDCCLSALECAIEIREHCLQEIERFSREPEDAMFPIRIGLHFDDVIVTDMGDDQQADITAVGKSVNFTKRLEQAATPMEILVSETFREAILRTDPSRKFYKKSIQIKHKKSLDTAWELEARFADGDNERIANVTRIMHQYFRRTKIEDRFCIAHLGLSIRTEGGVYKILDFSESGLLLGSQDFFPACGIKLRLINILDAEGDSIMLLQSLAPKILAEVRWSKKVEGEFYFGVRFDEDFRDGASHYISVLRNCYEDSRPKSVGILQKQA